MNVRGEFMALLPLPVVAQLRRCESKEEEPFREIKRYIVDKSRAFWHNAQYERKHA